MPNAQGLPPLRGQLTGSGQQIRSMKPVSNSALRLPPGAWFEDWEMKRKIRMLSREQSDSPESRFAADYCKGHNLPAWAATPSMIYERTAARAAPGGAGMSEILFGQSYFLRFDPKLWQAMQPYPPLGTLYAASYLRPARL